MKNLIYFILNKNILKIEKMPSKKTTRKSPSAKKSPARKSPAKKTQMPQILVVTSPKNSKKNSSSFLVVSTKSPRKPRAVKSPSKKSPRKPRAVKSPSKKSPKKSPSKKSSCKKSPSKKSPSKKSSSKKSPINMPILGYGKKPNCVTVMLK